MRQQMNFFGNELLRWTLKWTFKMNFKVWKKACEINFKMNEILSEILICTYFENCFRNIVDITWHLWFMSPLVFKEENIIEIV